MMNFHARVWLGFGVGCWLAAGPSAQAAEPTREQLEFFEKKIRPVFVEHCYRCHGPEKKPKAQLRVDSRAALLKGGESGPAIVPGEPDKSLLVKAVRFTDSQLKMPKGSKLADDHIADITAWVKMGAPWPNEAVARNSKPSKAFDLKERSKHWSLQPLKNVPLPAIEDRDWPKAPIDHFILSALEAQNLKPAAAAGKRTLLRRVTFDLIGMPPTPAEVEAFLADKSPEAFEKVVDRLLDSPHYGERWARHWLDLVRFAETYGHEFDFEIPEAWRYRDYVIRAFNNDVPYHQLVEEHIAGDLLPKPRRHPKENCNESILGTGFFWLGEAKHSPVDARGDQADRIDNQIDVFGKTFLGMTIACARCHDHKFDAISTKDYYALAGYLQSSRMQRAFLDAPESLREKITALRQAQAELTKFAVKLTAGRLETELDLLAKLLPAVRPDGPKGIWQMLGVAKSGGTFSTRYQAGLQKLHAQAKNAAARADSDVVFADFAKGGFKDWSNTGEAFTGGPSRGGDPIVQVSLQSLIQKVLPPGVIHSGQLTGKLQGALRSPTFTIGKKNIHIHASGKGVKINLVLDGLQLIRDPIYGGLTMTLSSDALEWRTMNVGMWSGQRAYLEILDDGSGYAVIDRVVFSDDGPPPDRPNLLLLALLADKTAADEKALVQQYRRLFAEIVQQWRDGKLAHIGDAADRVEILNWMLLTSMPEALGLRSEESAQLGKLLEKVQAADANMPTSHQRGLASVDGSPVNESVFIRGSHKKLGPEVPRRFLEVFGGTEDTPPKNGSGRLELAKRMTDPFKTPIVPRVFVNRLWQHHFGEGIVRSVDDFGVLGQPPTHPELLDYLAVQLVKNGWSMKEMHRMMLVSSTYQMSSRGDAKADERDPENKLLHKMPVRRLEAEAIRDAMLAVSGRLDKTMYGPGVMPHLTSFMVGRGRPGSSGPLDGGGRRSIYLNVRRNFLTPLFLAFDYPTPFSTMGRRSVSNVPAQALTLMNNPFVLQQAGEWAKRTVAEGKQSDRDRIGRMYETALSRPPSEVEVRAMLDYLQAHSGPQAWSDLAHVVFNLKEFIFLD
jgi:mono/diheme cytochrome c family protein